MHYCSEGGSITQRRSYSPIFLYFGELVSGFCTRKPNGQKTGMLNKKNFPRFLQGLNVLPSPVVSFCANTGRPTMVLPNGFFLRFGFFVRRKTAVYKKDIFIASVLRVLLYFFEQ